MRYEAQKSGVNCPLPSFSFRVKPDGPGEVSTGQERRVLGRAGGRGACEAGMSADQRLVARSPALGLLAHCVQAPRWPHSLTLTAPGLGLPVGGTG